MKDVCPLASSGCLQAWYLEPALVKAHSMQNHGPFLVFLPTGCSPAMSNIISTLKVTVLLALLQSKECSFILCYF